MKQQGPTLFLEKQSYRRRRLADAAKLLPVLGVILLYLPILWADDARTASGLIYVFGVWALLIVVMWLVSTRLSKAVTSADTVEPASRDSDVGG